MSDYYSVQKVTVLDAITRQVFPHHYLEPLPDEKGFAVGDMLTDVFVCLGWMDRLRMLLSGKLQIQLRTKTDVMVTKAKSWSTVSILAPWYKMNQEIKP